MRSFAYLIPALLAGSASAAAISNAFQAGGISERQTGLIVGIYFYDAVSCPQSGAQTVTDDDQRCHSIVGNRYRSFNVPFIRKGCTLTFYRDATCRDAEDPVIHDNDNGQCYDLEQFDYAPNSHKASCNSDDTTSAGDGGDAGEPGGAPTSTSSIIAIAAATDS